MIPATQIRNGMVILHEGQPHKVCSFRYTMSGRGSNQIPAKLRNIIDGSTVEVRYRSDDKIEKAFLEERTMEFLYQDGDEYVFMDNETFDQIPLQKEEIEDIIGYLTPNLECKVSMYEGRPIGVSPPTTVQLTVEETEPSIKGATASGNVTKPATLQTGLTIQVPMFVETGDTVIVNTVSGEYQGRPGKQ
jgi:elongation factor P